MGHNDELDAFCEHTGTMRCNDCGESFKFSKKCESDSNRICELEAALSESLRWMGKAIADKAFKDCCGDAKKYFDYFNRVLEKGNCIE